MKRVGDYQLNMDDAAKAVARTYPGIRLKVPYTLGVSLPMTNGGVYTFSSSDGTVDLSFRQGNYFWDKSAYFFSTTPFFVEFLE